MSSRLFVVVLVFVIVTAAIPQAQASPGDMNCDGAVNGLDVGAFVLAVINPSGYQAAYPGCHAVTADFDCDGGADSGDVDDFVDCLLTGNCPPCLPPGMVLIPAGEFQMGDTFHDAGGPELPVHAVYLNAFYMDIHEVTNQQYADALNWAWTQGGLITITSGVVYKYGSGVPYCDTTTSASYSGITWNGTTFGVTPGRENYPTGQVSWYGSVAYANWRSGMQGKPLCYSVSTWECNWGSGYRLPTEAEWEKAARGGGAGHRFPWSDSNTIQHARANYYSDAAWGYDTSPTRGYHPAFYTGVIPCTSPVGSFAPNDYGLHDMAGNVQEWCNDFYYSDYYSISPHDNPHGPTWGDMRILRGTCWNFYAVDGRCAARTYIDASHRYYSRGFRLALAAE
jgi:formylglycine-generating enzyme